ncbi:biotin-dependent carboxyltransferase family protein [Pseudoalteromonas sp. H105]|jgi:allophanate hydrolase/urea carboxylase|uniref:5-oxoprolinase subunit C family protein n=1 Tax=Pseudoalteromonas sp. H105 TaxID=1348393 RepID=UPI000732095C|nr:biotin-dependent carboxyltransferase family protein [Pseudoalteromonas sp. H105]KTF18283.1 allophanate hydrolase [Pseudoalteromonas sp. H105]
MIEVLKPGLLMSIQDLGRFGFRHLGVAQSGALDTCAMQLANALLENNKNDAVIEITLGLGKLRFTCNTVIALVGTDMNTQLDDIPIYPGWTYPVKQGQILSFKAAKNGLRGYLAVKGGILCEPVMGSCATDLAAGFGGATGFSLKEGDLIKVKPYDNPWPKRGAILPPKRHVIRIHPSIHADLLTSQTLHSFCATQWYVKPQSNRMGVRLSNENTTLAHSHSLPSLAVSPGSIQLPPNGDPIVLLNDAQTTGGYPLLGTVISADLFHFAQLKPGDTVSFEYVNKQIAEHAQKKIDAHFAQLSIVMNNRGRSLP